MATDPGRPSPAPPENPAAPASGSGLVYRSDRTEIRREQVPGAGAAGTATGPVIRKRCTDPDGRGAERVRVEAGMLHRLAGVPGVPRLVAGAGEAHSLLMTDTGHVSLAEFLAAPGPRPEGWLPRFALEVARVLAGVHGAGVVHRDISTGNVLVLPDGSDPMLVDFELATTFAEDRPEFTHPRQIAGTLPYLAPEQTGRTGRAVDHRADLYALGAVLYEVAAGSPPFGFGGDDPLELIHAHLARPPLPLDDVAAKVPAVLSAIVMRLLEKEPDRRYQSAEGLAHDLVRWAFVTPLEGVSPVLGSRDFPPRLAAPSRLVGREQEVAALSRAYQQVGQAAAARGVLVAGAPGVGKTALLDELRPLVTTTGAGWFITGKFDQYRHDQVGDAVVQALRGLGRLLLAEPEQQAEQLRERLLDGLGLNADHLAATVPELVTLLQVVPRSWDGGPAEVAARIHRSCVDLLAAVATPQRPVVMVLDDLQWAPGFALGALDAILTDSRLAGVLVVGGYRDVEVGPTHPLAAMLARWQRLDALAATLSLHNLPAADLGTFLAEMLRMQPDQTADLAAAIAAHTDGNPFDTIEFVNALRREGGLSLTERGWSWDAAQVRRFVGSGEVLDLIRRRMDALPEATRELMRTMACLGGAVELDLLRAGDGGSPGAAAGVPDGAADGADESEAWGPALEEGLLVLERGSVPALRFRHDRVQQAVHSSLQPPQVRARNLALARRLAGREQFRGVAAEQYLACVGDLTDAAERHRAAELFAAAAGRASELAQHEVAERYLSAAIGLLDGAAGGTGPGPDAAAAALRVRLAVEQHTALFALRRFAEADEVFGWIEHNCTDVLCRAHAVTVQLGSLTNRGLLPEALTLGAATLALLGHPVPAREDLGEQTLHGLDVLRAWVAGGDRPDLGQAEATDPRVWAIGKVIDRMVPAAFFAGDPLVAWLVTDACGLWAEHGPAPVLVGPLAHAAFATIAVAGDYRTGHAVVRRALAESLARGYEPVHSQALFLHSLSASPWFEPPTDTLRYAREGREGLVRGGDLWNAGFTFFSSNYHALNNADTLAEAEAEAVDGLAFASRTGNDITAGTLVIYRQAVRALRGLTAAPGSLSDDSFDADAHLAALGPNHTAAANFHGCSALIAAVFDQPQRLAHHAAAVMPLLPFVEATQVTVYARVWQGMGLAASYRATDPAEEAERARLLQEWEECRSWLERRAVDAPANFAHLHHLVQAEGARARNDFAAAARAFDAAQDAASRAGAPGHHALIVERAARFNLEHGLEHAGRAGLRRARQLYVQWGATAKVAVLDREFPFLTALTEAGTEAGTGAGTQPAVAGTSGERPRSTMVSSDVVDTLAILRAFQILSTETSPAGLQEQVAEVLALMTGATRIQLVLWDPDTGGWALPRPEGEEPDGGEAASLPVAEAAAAGLIPLSVFRYVERTRETLVVDDVIRDDRFTHDPYFTGVTRCALLAVPILSRGAPRAVLLLENRLARGVFAANRLDAVMLIAGELGICLDNILAERFRSLVRSSAELTLVCDRTATISYASTAAIDLLGIHDSDLLGRRLPDLLPPEDRETVADLVRTVGPGEPATVQSRVLHADGQPRWVEATLTDLTADPAVGGVMLRLRDITERHRLEIELRHAQKLESVGQLAAGIAHEINTPIQFISSNLAFLTDAFHDLAAALQPAAATATGATGATSDSDVDYLLEEIPSALAETTEGADRVATIVRAMKAFGHPGGESKAHADLNEAVRHTLVVAGNEIRPHADVVSDLAELPPVWCNIGDINQVVLNLVINAAHAMAAKAAAGGPRGTLTVRTRPDGEDVLIQVQDTGTGIPAEIADRVFDQFFTTKDVGTGTGQGLALAHTLVHDRHSGTLTFESTPGEGTTFTVRLPRQPG